jgi:L-lysine 2,3-aminomutase
VQSSGRQLAFMAHFSHPKELGTRAVADAMSRIRSSGAIMRCQTPLVRHVNNDATVFSEMWRRQVNLGAIPYYVFVARDTGPRQYFQVPLAKALRIFSTAYSEISGLARTVRGPCMSATPGKILIEGVTTVGGEDAFVLKMVQGRDPKWTNRVFFAAFDAQAMWLDQLQPAFGEEQFFFDPYIRAMYQGRWRPEWAQTGDDSEEMTA